MFYHFSPHYLLSQSKWRCLRCVSHVVQQSGHLRTLQECEKHLPTVRVFYISLVFSNACRVLSQCNTRVRLLYIHVNYKYNQETCSINFWLGFKRLLSFFHAPQTCCMHYNLIITKKENMFSVVLSSYRNMSRSLGQWEMQWEHEPQVSISPTFLSSPKLSRVFI